MHTGECLHPTRAALIGRSRRLGNSIAVLIIKMTLGNFIRLRDLPINIEARRQAENIAGNEFERR